LLKKEFEKVDVVGLETNSSILAIESNFKRASSFAIRQKRQEIGEDD
jgi:hypothetical protein